MARRPYFLAGHLAVIVHLFFLLSSCESRANDPEAEIRAALSAVAQRHSNFAMTGTLERERFLPRSAQETHLRSFEFRRLDNEMRYIREPVAKEDPAKRVVVSTEPLSFDVEFHNDGQELIKYLSPRRGVGFVDLRQTMFFEAGLYSANWGFNFDSFSRMLAEERMVIKRSGDTTKEPYVFDIVSMLPLKEVRHPDSTLLRYEGRIGFRKTPAWCVDFIELKTVYPTGDATGEMWISGKFEYRPELLDSIPVLTTATWETKAAADSPVEIRRTLRVKDISFGVCHPDDFTLAGSGVKTVNTAGAYSNIPLLAWYGGMVLIVSLVGLWLIRKRQRSAA